MNKIYNYEINNEKCIINKFIINILLLRIYYYKIKIINWKYIKLQKIISKY